MFDGDMPTFFSTVKMKGGEWNLPWAGFSLTLTHSKNNHDQPTRVRKLEGNVKRASKSTT